MLTDVGMNGPSNGVIGADFQSVYPRFVSGVQKGKIEQCLDGEYQVSALIAEFDTTSGACIHIEPISIQGKI